jgi:hypothetical protein
MSQPRSTADRWDRLYVYVHEAQLEARQLRRQSALVRHQTSLTQLAQHMRRANSLTLEVAAAIFRRYGLLSFTAACLLD